MLHVVMTNALPVSGTGKIVRRQGFTLIELAIVLVIIGLLVGGVLVGRDLLSAAALRAQISQIEKYQQAVNTFKGKYGYLPGDIPNPDATQFGFMSRGIYTGEGDGDGLILGISNHAAGNSWGNAESAGETVMLWADLGTAGLIDGRFNTARPDSLPGANITGTTLAAYLPSAKIARGNYIYAWSGGIAVGNNNAINYFGLSGTTNIASFGGMTSAPALTVLEAYTIDRKLDDGLPQSGNVIDLYLHNTNPDWAAGGGASGAWAGVATSAAATTCHDNGNITGAAHQYSITQNNGAGMNCALSFKFQ